MKINKTILFKIFYSICVILLFGAVMTILMHPAQNGRKTTEILPKINPDPVYVEYDGNGPIQINMTAKEDFSAGGFQVLLVNISQESKGTVRFQLTDANSNTLLNQMVPVETITPGEWFTITGDVTMTQGETYTLFVSADGSEPYFMQSLPGEDLNLPFEETVFKNGDPLSCGISLGVNKVEEVTVTYGDVLYYSVPFCILLTIVALICILVGRKRVWMTIQKVPFGTFFRKYGNDLFLLLLFFAVCLSIYIRAYQKGVYITADSAGYLREAVNLVNGNGFAYDGLAGYRSWFANWPIIYPAMIAMVMVITKANAYLASKIVAMLIVAGILILMRVVFKKDAWVYALCLTNIGFLNLTYYTWSEIPFMLFLTAYALVLSKILNEEEPKSKWYVLLSVLGLCCFLTRYFGIYVYIVTGLYILYLAVQYWKKKDRMLLKKTVSLTISSFLSGICCLAYLMMNRLMNGKASGVSRTLWWDDYEKLTNDLIESLLTEFFNIFSLQIPDLIEGFPYEMKVFVLVIIILGVAVFVGRHTKVCSRESVMITMGVLYYLIFIAIRYVSSMDTFYFRFFEPATFLICIGIIGLLLPYFKEKNAFCFFGGGVTAMILIAVISLCMNTGGLRTTGGYYEQLTAQWEEQYEEIPEKSVIIFNDIDFRSSYYRPDVMEGMITPQDTFENIRETYYGSDYLCIRREFAQSMLESGEYEQSIVKHLQEGMDTQDSQKEFLVISFK